MRRVVSGAVVRGVARPDAECRRAGSVHYRVSYGVLYPEDVMPDEDQVAVQVGDSPVAVPVPWKPNSVLCPGASRPL